MRVLTIYDVPGWCYHRRAIALMECSPPDIEAEICPNAEVPWDRVRRGEFDVVFNLDYSLTRSYRQQMGDAKTPFLVSFNRDRHTRHRELRLTLADADLVICNNADVWEHIRIAYPERFPKCVQISNGVDLGTFYPITPIEKRPLRCLWTGSTGAAKKKGYHDILLPLRQSLLHEFEFDLRPIDDMADPRRMNTRQMVDWYNTGSVILCAAESEGTPNTTLEGMACGCIPVSTNVANIQEMGSDGVNASICNRTVEDLAAGILRAMGNRTAMSHAARQTLVNGGWDWPMRSRYFYAVFRRVASDGVRAVRPFTYQETAPECL